MQMRKSRKKSLLDMALSKILIWNHKNEVMQLIVKQKVEEMER